jgi:hypothetical protein
MPDSPAPTILVLLQVAVAAAFLLGLIVMANTFEILSGFLKRYSDEVEGREIAGPTPEITAQLQKFARGQLDTTAHADLIRQLNEQPAWVAQLAREVKALRPGEKS